MKPSTKAITYLLKLLLIGLTKELAVRTVAEKFEITVDELIKKL